jgi:uncharacterized protein
MRMDLDEIRERVGNAARRYDERLIAVYLFGSRAAGQATPLSDLDLAVLLDPRERPFTLSLRCALYADFSRVLQTNDIDLTVLNTLDNLFVLDEILRHGVLLYDPRPDLRADFEVRMQHRILDFKDHRCRVMGE